VHITHAADVLLGGGVIAYPTEGVYGLGCMPDDAAAIARLLRIKQRDPAKGLILIAAHAEQFAGWIEGEALPAPRPQQPITWIVAPGPRVSPLVRGDNAGLAVRITTNPVAAAICERVASPIISTSANISNHPTARNRYVLQRQFRTLVDYIVPGDCGPASGPSEIRDRQSGKILRPGAA
jgi:L-threonylcarbamoyladenylate synthase